MGRRNKSRKVLLNVKDSEILIGAADLIERYGWTGGTFGNYVDGFCTMGAIFAVAGRFTYAHKWVSKVLWPGNTFAHSGVRIAKWNDAMYMSVRDRRFILTRKKR